MLPECAVREVEQTSGRMQLKLRTSGEKTHFKFGLTTRSTFRLEVF